jgi:hypothetical protein
VCISVSILDGAKFILTCLDVSSEIDFASGIDYNLRLGFVAFDSRNF